jgi:hypothetical protein
VILHSPNCALPELVLPIYGAIFSLFWLVTLIDLIQKIRVRKLKKITIGLALMNHFCVEGYVLSCVIQQGNFEGSILFLCMIVIVLLLLASDVSVMMYTFCHVFHTQQIDRIRWTLWASSSSMGLLLLGSMGGVMYYIRSEQFDLAYFVLLGEVYVLLICFCWIAMRYIDEFLHLLKEKKVEEYSEISIRIRTMKKKFIGIILGNFPAIPFMIIIRQVLRSFPYMWVLYVLSQPMFLISASAIVNMYPVSKGGSSTGAVAHSRDPSKVDVSSKESGVVESRLSKTMMIISPSPPPSPRNHVT